MKIGDGSKMDTLTMVEEAMANPEWTFETTNCMVNGKVHYNQGLLQWVGNERAFILSDATVKYKWRRVPKPVDFMTAAKAYLDGEIIVCEICNQKVIYKDYLEFLDSNGMPITTAEIVHGDWYIK